MQLQSIDCFSYREAEWAKCYSIVSKNITIFWYFNTHFENFIHDLHLLKALATKKKETETFHNETNERNTTDLPTGQDCQNSQNQF